MHLTAWQWFGKEKCEQKVKFAVYGTANLFVVLILIVLLRHPGAGWANHSLKSRMVGLTITQTGPLSCPDAGCAGGQRVNMGMDFDLSTFDSSQPNANVKLCLYAPAQWIDPASLTTSAKGAATGVDYATAGDCAEDTSPPAGYVFIGARSAKLGANMFADSLQAAFRLAKDATGSGKVLVRLFENASTGWTRTQQATSPSIALAPAPSVPTAAVYVASSAADCNTFAAFATCFVNSADDLPGGLGTGLKDAIDARPEHSVIIPLGQYMIKSNTVTVDKAVILEGVVGSTVTYGGNTCSNSMLLLTRGASINNLEVNDGSNCPAGHRDLIEVNSPDGVVIEYNHLTRGNRAIWVHDNNGGVTVRYNQIDQNAAQAVFWEGAQSAAPLEVVGNNLVNNGLATSNAANGTLIDCGTGATAALPARKAEHNYWGGLAVPSASNTHCIITPGKQLGAAVAARPGAWGVQVRRVMVTTTKTYAYNNQIAYQHTDGGSDFDLYLVNHGFGGTESAPFASLSGYSPSPCGNYWDVFLVDGPIPQGTLNLFLKYDKTPGCLATINSTQFCEQTATTPDASVYPLWWYEPAHNVTNLWNMTGQNPNGSGAGGAVGQTTTCHPDLNEIQVAVDTSGRPALDKDFNYLPLMTGIQVLNTFNVSSSNKNVTMVWSTNVEPEVSGFYMLRGTDGNHFSPITDLISRKGNNLSGATYSFVDANRPLDSTFYYRLEIVRTDNTILYSPVQSSMVTLATATHTPTPGPTATYTRTPGPTPTRTIPPPTATQVPTRVPTSQPTRIPSATLTVWSSGSGTPSPVVLTLQTNTSTITPQATYTLAPTGSGTPPFDSTIGTGTARPQGTGKPTSSLTVLATPMPGQSGGGSALPEITSILIGFSVGMLLLGGVGIGLFFTRNKLKP